jgi:hypothetical protein
MRTRTAFRRTALAAAAVGLAALTACSSGTSGTAGAAGQGTHAGPSGSGYDSVESITRCFRQHGDPGFPDPVYDPSDGRWHFGTSPNSAPASARQACQNLFPAVNPSPPVPQAEFQELLQFARCMRQHGVQDWPDPTVSGDFALPHDLLTKTPTSDAAMSACSRYIPSGGLNVSAA